MMDEIEHPWSANRSSDEPQIPFKPDQRNEQKSRRDTSAGTGR
jgi:hypothetical protein